MIPAPPPPTLHLPYAPGPFRMAMGLTVIPEAMWIEIDSHYAAHLAQRKSLLDHRRADVLAALPDTEEARRALLASVAAHLSAGFPHWFHRDGEAIENLLTGERHVLRDPADDPLAVVGRLVQEDFCLLRQEPDGLRLIAAVLCFPSRWRLADKIGRLLGPIHAPVPHYEARLAQPVDRFLARLAPDRIAMRFNWSIHDDDALFQPTGHARDDHVTAVTPDNAGEALFLRVERQTFRRLPDAAGTIAFGIRTHVTPLHIIAGIPGEAARLASAVAALPAETQRYKGLLPFRATLLAYLGSV